ncbi:MAG: hypothetical protein HC940_01905 [Acaryochloris sp. SU_5_25]|nr:hypothetical protein [Acaryochloris sp. SU_5_25]
MVISFLPLFLAWVITRKSRSQNLKASKTLPSDRHASKVNVAEPEFYLIEKYLEKWDLQRRASEPIKQWLLRLEQKLSQSQMQDLHPIIDLHYRCQCDP